MFIDKIKLLFAKKLKPMKYLSGVLDSDSACQIVEIDADFKKNKNMDWEITDWHVRAFHDDEHPGYSSPIAEVTLKALNGRVLEMLNDMTKTFFLNTNKHVEISITKRNSHQNLWRHEIIIKKEPLWRALCRWMRELLE